MSSVAPPQVSMTKATLKEICAGFPSLAEELKVDDIPTQIDVLVSASSQCIKCCVNRVRSGGQHDDGSVSKEQVSAYTLRGISYSKKSTGENVVVWPTSHGDLRTKVEEVLHAMKFPKSRIYEVCADVQNPADVAFFDFEGKEILLETSDLYGAIPNENIAFILLCKYEGSGKGPVVAGRDDTDTDADRKFREAHLKWFAVQAKSYPKVPMGKKCAPSCTCQPEYQDSPSIKSTILKGLSTGLLTGGGASCIAALTALIGGIIGTVAFSWTAIAAAIVLAIICITLGSLFAYLSTKES